MGSLYINTVTGLHSNLQKKKKYIPTHSLLSAFFRPRLGAGADSLVKESGEDAPESRPPVSRPTPGRPLLPTPRLGRRPRS